MAANVQQARKAFELTEGHHAGIVDTLARVLHATGQGDEARTLLADSLERDWESWERNILQETQAHIQPTVSADRKHVPMSYLLLVVLGLGVALLIGRGWRTERPAEVGSDLREG